MKIIYYRHYLRAIQIDLDTYFKYPSDIVYWTVVDEIDLIKDEIWISAPASRIIKGTDWHKI